MSDTPEKGWKSSLTENVWVAVIIPLLTIVVSFALSEMQSAPSIGWKGVVCAIILVLGLYGIVVWWVRRPLIGMLEELKSDLVLKHIQTQQGWLLDAAQLVSYERNVKAKEIWLITSDLLDDSQGGPFMKVVSRNLQKNIRYVYFYSNTPENKARADAIRTTQKSDLLKYVVLPDSFFFLVPKLDIVIYNPRGEGGLSQSAFMGIPVPGESNHYHAAVSLDFIHKIVGTLLESEAYKKQIGN
ncbi:MAG: hypothetical protein HY360_16180 [Verrucomicrobia bacterium]|nr:hypothetical protein [Verrucomicrobiota bacterium]